jgi:hypothetical protein
MTAIAMGPPRHVNGRGVRSLGGRGRGYLTRGICRETIDRVRGPRHRLDASARCPWARGR